jgi:hypothetical protein
MNAIFARSGDTVVVVASVVVAASVDVAASVVATAKVVGTGTVVGVVGALLVGVAVLGGVVGVVVGSLVLDEEHAVAAMAVAVRSVARRIFNPHLQLRRPEP